MRILIAGLMLVALSAEAEGVCLTLAQARKQWPEAYLRYRVDDGDHCWYNPKIPRVKLAKLTPPPQPKRPVSQPPAPPPPPDPTPDEIQQALCRGPCPRFDLHFGPDGPLYNALCGGPCPDFRKMKMPGDEP